MTPRVKYYLLLFVFAILFVLIYNLLIKNNIELTNRTKKISRNEFIEKEKEYLNLLDDNKFILNKFNSKFDTYNDFRLSLFSKILKFEDTSGIEILTIPDISTYTLNGYELTLDSIVLKGEYFSLVKLLYFIETSSENNGIATVQLKSVKEIESGQQNLLLIIKFLFIKDQKII